MLEIVLFTDDKPSVINEVISGQKEIKPNSLFTLDKYCIRRRIEHVNYVETPLEKPEQFYSEVSKLISRWIKFRREIEADPPLCFIVSNKTSITSKELGMLQYQIFSAKKQGWTFYFLTKEKYVSEIATKAGCQKTILYKETDSMKEIIKKMIIVSDKV